MKLDSIDFEILNLLRADAKLSFKQIGEKIHLTGQAVGTRINKLIDDGVIENFTVKLNKEKLGITILALIKVYMHTFDHSKIKELVSHNEEVVEAYRVSGDGCYFLKIETSSNERLNILLDEINQFANYQLSLSVSRLK